MIKNIKLPDPKQTEDSVFYASLSEQQKLPQNSANSVTEEKRPISEDEAEKLYDTTNPNNK
jgi:hypothetical protein